VSGVLNIAQLVAVLVCFVVIDKVGRRPLALYGAIGMAVPYVIMAVLVELFDKDWPAHVAAGWATTAMAFVYILVYGVSYSPLAWALPAEVFPSAARAKGVALSTATVWLSNFVVGVMVPPMIQNAGFGTYVFFAVFCVLAAVWAYFLVPETMGRTLEQMDEVFGDGAAEEEK
ncbi:general substrate transporter, partial [Mytilinidion resinicola]